MNGRGSGRITVGKSVKVKVEWIGETSAYHFITTPNCTLNESMDPENIEENQLWDTRCGISYRLDDYFRQDLDVLITQSAADDLCGFHCQHVTKVTIFCKDGFEGLIIKLQHAAC